MNLKVTVSKVEFKAALRTIRYGVSFLLLFFLILRLVGPEAAWAQNSGGIGAVEGAVFVTDSRGTSSVPGAEVTLQGSETSLQTETNGEGRYNFPGLRPGMYSIAATLPGLQAVQEITIQSGAASKVDLDLKPVAITTSVTVTDTAIDEKASPETITEKTIADAPNVNEQFETLLPLVPGVVRGPDGHINMKGARNTQSGALVNSANVTDPATGGQAINLPIDVVSSVQVISNPYDPQYGKLTGTVSTVEIKTGNYEDPHFTIQNIFPRPRVRDGSVMGIESATPRMTFTGPILKGKIAITQSFEYRFVETPVNSLPASQRDQKLEGFNSYTQFDFNISNRQTATVSLAIYPQKLEYAGLNTFTPQPSTADYHQRGYQVYVQDRYLTGSDSALVSQFSYKTYDIDTTAQSNQPYQLLIDTTKGGFFNRQSRRTSRIEWQESYNFAPRQFLGSHRLKVGLDCAHSSFHGKETLLPAELIGMSGSAIERITFMRPTSFDVNQNETALYVADEWSPTHRVTADLGFAWTRTASPRPPTSHRVPVC